ncbi:MAG: hypothetical protein V1799_15500 [bacterium]
MEHEPSKHTNKKIFQTILFGLFFALLAIVTLTPIYPKIWGTTQIVFFGIRLLHFWIPFTLSIWFWLRIAFLLLVIYAESSGSQDSFIKTMRRWSIDWPETLSMWYRQRSQLLTFKYFAAGLITFLLISAGSWIGLYYIPDFYLMQRYMYASKDPKISNSPVVLLQYTSENNEQTRYLKSCLKIVTDLKAVGAKAVLLDARSIFGKKAQVDLLKQLAETGVVVFGFPRWSKMRFTDSLGEISLTRGNFNLEVNLVEGPSIFRIDPEDGRDVLFQLIKKYRNLPDTEQALKKGNTLLFADYEIPLNERGEILIRPHYPMFYDSSPYVNVLDGMESDSLRYSVTQSPKPPTIIQPPSFDKFRDAFEGKVVILNWYEFGSFYNSSKYEVGKSQYLHAYAWAFYKTLNKQYVREFPNIHYLISLCLLVFAGFISLKLRPIVSFLILLGVSILIYTSAPWLYTYHDIIVRMMHPLLTSILAAALFPAMRMIHDARRGVGE